MEGKVSVLSYISGDIDSSLYGQELPVGKAKIKIERKKCSTCRWKKLVEIKTNDEGKFFYSSIQTGAACASGLKTRAKIKFESSEMELRRGSFLDEYGLSPKWYLLKKLDKSNCQPSGDCNFGNLIFRVNNENDLDDFTAIIHADIWYFYNWAKKQMGQIGMPIIKNSNEKIRVVYPLNRLVIPDNLEGSYVNPNSKIIHIHEDHHRFDIVLHELAHLWAFNNTTGESVMKNYLLTKFSTHDLVSKPEVAFHEGFADWWMMILKNRYLFEAGEDLKAPEIILKKYFNEQMNIQSHDYPDCQHSLRPKKRKRDLGRLECHEKGWLNIFQLLTLDDFILPGSSFSEEVFTYDLYSSQNPRGQFATKLNHGVEELTSEDLSCRPYPLNLSLLGLLEVVSGMDSTSMNLNGFIDQIKNKLQIGQEHLELFKDIIDPTNQENLSSYYCQNSLIVKGFALPGFDPYEWDTIDGFFVKRNPLRINVKNMASIETGRNSFLHTPISSVHENTDDNFELEKISLPLSGLSMPPGEEVSIDQIIKVNKKSNGSFPLTTLTYRTSVQSRPRNISSNSTAPILNSWRTNSKNFTFGPDLKTSIKLNDSENKKLLYGFSERESSSLSTEEFNILSVSPDVSFRNNIDDRQNSLTKKIVHGECIFKNIGNVSTFIPTEAQIKLNGKKLTSITIPEVKANERKVLPFKMIFNKRDLEQGPKIDCEINKYLKSPKIEELRYFNNRSSIFVFKENRSTTASEIQGHRTNSTQRMEKSLKHEILESNIQRTKSHKGTLKVLRNHGR